AGRIRPLKLLAIRIELGRIGSERSRAVTPLLSSSTSAAPVCTDALIAQFTSTAGSTNWKYETPGGIPGVWLLSLLNALAIRHRMMMGGIRPSTTARGSLR